LQPALHDLDVACPEAISAVLTDEHTTVLGVVAGVIAHLAGVEKGFACGLGGILFTVKARGGRAIRAPTI
jgi:hypothetical protein